MIRKALEREVKDGGADSATAQGTVDRLLRRY
jgi:hypothetical protein